MGNRICKKCHLSVFECGLVDADRQAGLSISEIADLQQFSVVL